MGNIDYGPIMIAIRNEIDAIHYKTYGVIFRDSHFCARDYIETRRIN